MRRGFYIADVQSRDYKSEVLLQESRSWPFLEILQKIHLANCLNFNGITNIAHELHVRNRLIIL